MRGWAKKSYRTLTQIRSSGPDVKQHKFCVFTLEWPPWSGFTSLGGQPLSPPERRLLHIPWGSWHCCKSDSQHWKTRPTLTPLTSVQEVKIIMQNEGIKWVTGHNLPTNVTEFCCWFKESIQTKQFLAVKNFYANYLPKAQHSFPKNIIIFMKWSRQ